MQLIESIPAMKEISRRLQSSGSLGFVPTMGYLHEGHLSLVDASVKENPHTVASIFVNPAQFGKNEDLSTYPRDLERDLKHLQSRGVDYVFYPQASDIYPEDYGTWVDVDKLGDLHCGKSRPGHFRGVCTIVLKLVNIIMPGFMYMGAKDFQQLVILQKMLQDLNLDTQIVPCPIVREDDGLAISSRNTYLDADERKRALCLSQALAHSRQLFMDGMRDSRQLIKAAAEIINNAGGQIDYIECVHPQSLLPVELAEADTRMLMAVYIGRTRLIDNAPMA
ncbi:MAG: pantoate--beta-alanine ligase [Candidatus Cloacimonetes bacterium]|nr:pantoate--beta-alanine ligase [Candidatus Cloacimonadota bacterium]